jgi:ribosomal protein S18 acetylase RimI-like enzyme
MALPAQGREPTVDLTLRTRTATDERFLFDLYADTRDDVVRFGWNSDEVDEFLGLQYRAREHSFRISRPHAQSDIVVVNGQDVGRLMVDRRPEEIYLVDIAVCTEHRGGGIGSRLMADLMEEGALLDCPLRLEVQPAGRALAFYRKLGFVPSAPRHEIDPWAMYLAMEWRAS